MNQLKSARPDLTQVILVKLGVQRADAFDPALVESIWQKFLKQDNSRKILQKLGVVIAGTTLADLVAGLVESQDEAPGSVPRAMRERIITWVKADERHHLSLVTSLRNFLEKVQPDPASKAGTGASAPAVGVPPLPAESPLPIAGVMASDPLPGLPLPGVPAPPPMPEPPPLPSPDAAANPGAATPSLAPSAWKYIPVPADLPDPVDDYDQAAAKAATGYALLAARVRGKKHKYDGTPCDDSFCFDVAGPWTILAVSDGAGSKRFSRVGSRASCAAAVESLKLALARQEIKARDVWKAESFQEDDLMAVREALIFAVREAWNATAAAVAARAENPAYARILGRPLTVDDLSATLLIAVHRTVPTKEGPKSLVFGCSIGDGMISVIQPNGRASLLMTPDSGAHSGETLFLSEKESRPERVGQRLFPYLGSLQSLLLMTDGVADDYFPNDIGMSRLYGDLVLNGILSAGPASDQDVDRELDKTRIPTRAELAVANYEMVSERLTANGQEAVPLLSLEKLAPLLDPDLGLEALVGNRVLLAAAAAARPVMRDATPLDRLRIWLDSYHVRGSFDDRTLIAMFPSVAD